MAMDYKEIIDDNQSVRAEGGWADPTQSLTARGLANFGDFVSDHGTEIITGVLTTAVATTGFSMVSEAAPAGAATNEVAASAAPAPNYVPYTNQPGDTLSGISNRLAPSLNETPAAVEQQILAAPGNDIPNPNLIIAGKSELVPTPPTATMGTVEVRIAAGDTYSGFEQDIMQATQQSPAVAASEVAQTWPATDLPIGAVEILTVPAQYVAALEAITSSSTEAPTPSATAAALGTVNITATEGMTYDGLDEAVAKTLNESLAQADTQVPRYQSPTDIKLNSALPVTGITAAEGAAIQGEIATPAAAAAVAAAPLTTTPAETNYDIVAVPGTTYSGIITQLEKVANLAPAQASADVVQNQPANDIGLNSKIPVNGITPAEGAAVQATLDAAANTSQPVAITMAPEATAAPVAEAPVIGTAAQLTPEQALQISNNSENSPNPYLEQWAIGSLTQLAQVQGIPLTDTLTQEHVNFLLAWAWVEKGDLDNNGTYNALNTGVDIPALLATANNGSGLQAFISQQAGETADVDTFLSGYQNRIGRILSDPSSTAEDCISTLTWFENAPGDQPWAGMDNPAEGFSQTEYQDTLLSKLSWVRANYALAGTVPLGYTYDMYKPHVSASLLQFTGSGPIGSDNAIPAPVSSTTSPTVSPPPAPTPETTTTTTPAAQPAPSPTEARVPVPSKAPTTTTTSVPTLPEVTLPLGASVSNRPGILEPLTPGTTPTGSTAQK